MIEVTVGVQGFAVVSEGKYPCPNPKPNGREINCITTDGAGQAAPFTQSFTKIF